MITLVLGLRHSIEKRFKVDTFLRQTARSGPQRRGGLMVSAFDSGANAPGSSPGQGHCVVFLGKTLYSQSASLHPGV